MDCKNIKGNVVVIFRTGREANKFVERNNICGLNLFCDDHGLCACRFRNGKYSGYSSNPKATYEMGDDYTSCKTVNFNGIVYNVVFYRKKAVIV